MNFDNYKFRCSELGKLTGEPKLKADKEAGNLSQTAKEHLNAIWIREKYGRFQDITSKYMEKGNLNEEDSLTMYQNKVGGLLLKNDEEFENDWIKGTPDLVLEDKVIDLKTSWDIWTYMKADVKDMYLWQLMGYMWLTNTKKAELCYCLTDTPEHIIQDEIRKLGWKMPFVDQQNDPDFLAAEAQIRLNMTFGDIPESDRIKIYGFGFDESLIETLKLKILKAREYLNGLSL